MVFHECLVTFKFLLSIKFVNSVLITCLIVSLIPNLFFIRGNYPDEAAEARRNELDLNLDSLYPLYNMNKHI